MAEDLFPLIEANQPFPETDLEAIPPDPFGIPADCKLASYLSLETALESAAGLEAASLAGMLAPGDAAHRYTVLQSLAGGAPFAVVAAVRRESGARDQVQAVLEAPLAPSAVASPEGLAGGRAILFTLDASLRFSPAPQPLRFGFHWLREIASGVLEGQVGEEIDSGIEASVHARVRNRYLAAAALDDQGWLRLRLFRHGESALGFSSSMEVRAAVRTPLRPEQEPLVRAILAAGAYAAAPVAHALRTTDTLVRAIYEKALPALERKYAARLSWSYQTAARGTALLDCSFAFNEQGMAAYRRALDGDFSGLPEAPPAGVRVHDAAFTAAIAGRGVLELHLPFMDRKAWVTRWEALAKAEIEAGDDGRLFVYTVAAADRVEQNSVYQSTLALAGSLAVPREASFELSYTDTRAGEAGHLARSLAPLLDAYEFPAEASRWLEAAGAAGGELSASLSLGIPGAAVAAWLGAPAERDADFFDVYSKISVAVQQAMRRWLPYVYFSDAARYDDLATAYPLVFFTSTRPFGGQPRSDFAYDLVGPGSPGVARPWAARPLATELGRVQQLLLAGGRTATARFYAPWRAPEILAGIVKNPRLLNALLTGDAFFVDRLVRLGVEARSLAAALAGDPRKAAKCLVAFAADFTALFHRRLRRLYGGRDFVAFGSLLLVEATRALGAALGTGIPVSASLRLSAGGREQTFVNAGYRPH